MVTGHVNYDTLKLEFITVLIPTLILKLSLRYCKTRVRNVKYIERDLTSINYVLFVYEINISQANRVNVEETKWAV